MKLRCWETWEDLEEGDRNNESQYIYVFLSLKLPTRRHQLIIFETLWQGIFQVAEQMQYHLRLIIPSNLFSTFCENFKHHKYLVCFPNQPATVFFIILLFVDFALRQLLIMCPRLTSDSPSFCLKRLGFWAWAIISTFQPKGLPKLCCPLYLLVQCPLFSSCLKVLQCSISKHY